MTTETTQPEYNFDDPSLIGGLPELEKTEAASSTEVPNEAALLEFLEYVGSKPYLAIPKKAIRHFMETVAYHSRIGFDTYTKSFKMDTSVFTSTGKVALVYNNGNLFASSHVEALMGDGFTSNIVSVDTLLKIYSASTGGYVFLFIDGSNIYGYVLGGKVFLETYTVQTDICTEDYLLQNLANELISEGTAEATFIPTLRNLYDIVRSGTRIEEKALYFENETVHIFSGVVTGQFSGAGLTATLQDIDISTLTRFFVDIVGGEITVKDYGLFVTYISGSRCLYLQRRDMKLSSDMKYKHINTSGNSVTVDVNKVLSIVSFLLSMATNAGDVTMSTDGGLVITCQQRAGGNPSVFKVPGTIQGAGTTEVKVSLDVLKTFLKVFTSEVNMQTVGNKLYVSGAEGAIVIMGGL